MNFLKEHNVFLKILSLIIAIFLWSFVVLSENPLKTQSFSNQPVQEVGTETLEGRGLMMVNTEQAKITLKVTGTSKDMASLSAADITAQVDLSNIQEAGVYYIQPSIAVQKQVDSISFQPRRLQITIENIKTKEIPVEVTTMNTLKEDQLLDNLSPSQTTIQITGAESIVETVDHALLTVDLENLSKNKAQTCRVALYTAEDALVDSDLVTPEVEQLDVTVGLNQVKTVPLSVSLVDSPTLTSAVVTATLSPQQVRVYGSEQALANVTGISLGKIDLANVKADGEEHTLTIPLPEGVSLMEGEPKQVRVKLTMQDGINRTLVVSDVQLYDTNESETKPELTLETQSIEVQVEGKANVMSVITEQDIHVTVTVDSSQLEPGTHDVPCEITCDLDGVRIVTEDVTVRVTVPEPPEPPEELPQEEEMQGS